jgi:glycosyltransferase involved in cell wall biosynthesis
MNEPQVEAGPEVPARGPVLSAVVISQNDEGVIRQRIGALLDQHLDEELEVIVVTSGNDATADIVRASFPTVRVVELDHPVLPGEARNAGLRAAAGRYVVFPGSHQQVEPGLFDATVRGHRLGYTMVTGPMLNGTTTLAGWATYLLENSGLLPGRAAGQLDAFPVRCSYIREVLVELGGFPGDTRAAEDTAVNQELFRRGFSAYRAGTGASRHFSPCARPTQLVRHHFARGRGFGRVMIQDRFATGYWIDGKMLHFLVLSVPQRIVSVGRNVRRWGGRRLRLRFWSALPMIVLASLSSWIGTCYEIAVTAARPQRYGRAQR